MANINSKTEARKKVREAHGYYRKMSQLSPMGLPSRPKRRRGEALERALYEATLAELGGQPAYPHPTGGSAIAYARPERRGVDVKRTRHLMAFMPFMTRQSKSLEPKAERAMPLGTAAVRECVT